MINVNDHFTKKVQKVNLAIKNRFAMCTCLAYNQDKTELSFKNEDEDTKIFKLK